MDNGKGDHDALREYEKGLTSLTGTEVSLTGMWGLWGEGRS